MRLLQRYTAACQATRTGRWVRQSQPFHAILRDSAFTMDDSGNARLLQLEPPGDEETASIVDEIVRRIIEILAARLHTLLPRRSVVLTSGSNLLAPVLCLCSTWPRPISNTSQSCSLVN